MSSADWVKVTVADGDRAFAVVRQALLFLRDPDEYIYTLQVICFRIPYLQPSSQNLSQGGTENPRSVELLDADAAREARGSSVSYLSAAFESVDMVLPQ